MKHARRIIAGVKRRGVYALKKTIVKNPVAKDILKRIAYTQLGVLSAADRTYKRWVEDNFPDYITALRLRRELDSLKYTPLVSVIMPVYNTKPDFLRDAIESVMGQLYENWELCIVDDASPNALVKSIIREYADRDKRIQYKLLKENRHIAAATNAAIEMANGEFCALFDHDDILWPNALFEVIKALNEDTSIDFLYTDEDKITENRHEHLGPFFKPDWNPDFLHSVNYITHLATIRTSLLRELGGERTEYNGAQDWDLFLRITGATKRIHHIPKVVYSWRIHNASTAKSTDAKPYVVAAQQKAIQSDLERRGYEFARAEQDAKHSGYWRVVYPVQDNPLVSIVIPSKNNLKVLKRCIESIYRKSSYKNYEIILVDTGSDDRRVWSWYKKLQAKYANFTLLEWPEQPFSYARSCNEGARVAKGEILVMLNNDTEVLTPDWIEGLAGEVQRKEIGAAGCLLFYPDKRHVQHAGVGIGLGGVAANSLQTMRLAQYMTQTQHLYMNTRHNMTAVTAACMAIRKEVFDEINGFDETFRITYNDVDLCLRLYTKGYRNVYTPYVRLVHHESFSLGMPNESHRRDAAEFDAAKKRFVTQWKAYVTHDPNINPNLDKTNALYDLAQQDMHNTTTG